MRRLFRLLLAIEYACGLVAANSPCRVELGARLNIALRLIVALSLSCCAARQVTQPVPATSPKLPSTVASAAFLLQKTKKERCLVDQKGNPFLLQGDAAWSLLVQLTREEADHYLKDRWQRGFNALLMNLLEHKFARSAPKNAYGEAPFAEAGDFAQPNERYFAHVDWVLERAAEYGFLVLLTPSYLGYDGGDEGWYRKMKNVGAAQLRAYGRYLGMRYRNLKNVIWVHGGDYYPPDFSVVQAVLDGVLESAPDSKNSFHGTRGTAARKLLPEAQWLFLSTIYTDEKSVVPAALAEHAASQMPFILVEGRYEGEGASESIVRAQAYQAVLSGACGQIMGNKHVWSFDSEWKAALDSPGARSMSRMRMLLDMLAWWNLKPAGDGFIVEGAGTGGKRAAAAVSWDRRRAVVYVPSARELVLDATYLEGANVKVSWVDPTPAHAPVAVRSPLAAARRIALRTPGKNGSGNDDWLVVLDSIR